MFQTTRNNFYIIFLLPLTKLIEELGKSILGAELR